MQKRGATPNKTAVIGASIGANLSLQFIAEHPEIKKVAALSPGLNYRGVNAKSAVQQFNIDQSVVFVTSNDDGANTAQNQELYTATSVKNKHLIIFEAGGHGTNMFSAKIEYDLAAALLKFLEHGTIN